MSRLVGFVRWVGAPAWIWGAALLSCLVVWLAAFVGYDQMLLYRNVDHTNRMERTLVPDYLVSERARIMDEMSTVRAALRSGVAAQGRGRPWIVSGVERDPAGATSDGETAPLRVDVETPILVARWKPGVMVRSEDGVQIVRLPLRESWQCTSMLGHVAGDPTLVGRVEVRVDPRDESVPPQSWRVVGPISYDDLDDPARVVLNEVCKVATISRATDHDDLVFRLASRAVGERRQDEETTP